MSGGQRGFTLAEILLVGAIMGVISAGAGAFYVQGRVSGARIEAQVKLQRDASLISEIVSRDLRSTRTTSEAEGVLSLATSSGPVRYLIEAGALIRDQAGTRWLIAHHVKQINVTPWATTGFKLTVALELELTAGNRVNLERAVLVRGLR